MANMDNATEWDIGLPRAGFEWAWNALRELHPELIEETRQFNDGLVKKYLRFDGEWGKGLAFEVYTPGHHTAHGHPTVRRWITKKAWEELGRPNLRTHG
jgi:hypothetical protein